MIEYNSLAEDDSILQLSSSCQKLPCPCGAFTVSHYTLRLRPSPPTKLGARCRSGSAPKPPASEEESLVPPALINRSRPSLLLYQGHYRIRQDFLQSFRESFCQDLHSLFHLFSKTKLDGWRAPTDEKSMICKKFPGSSQTILTMCPRRSSLTIRWNISNRCQRQPSFIGVIDSGECNHQLSQ
jgi:hypothetical protein